VVSLTGMTVMTLVTMICGRFLDRGCTSFRRQVTRLFSIITIPTLM
jgi:hypothetical protein